MNGEQRTMVKASRALRARIARSPVILSHDVVAIHREGNVFEVGVGWEIQRRRRSVGSNTGRSFGTSLP